MNADRAINIADVMLMDPFVGVNCSP